MKQVHWRWMNADLHKLSEGQVARLLYMEVDGAKRRNVVIRLHQRLCTLRAKRERADLLREIDQ